MARAFKYEISPVLLKAVLDSTPLPSPEKAMDHFFKIHKVPRKSWNSNIKLPVIQISKVYLNGIIVAVFSLLFFYFVFFHGFTGKSEKSEAKPLVRKVPSNHKAPSPIPINERVQPLVDTIRVKPEVTGAYLNNDTARSKHHIALTHSTPVSSQSINSNSGNIVGYDTTNKPGAEESHFSNKKEPMITVTNDSTNFSDLSKDKKNKRKKRKRKITEQAEILPPASNEGNLIPSGHQPEEELPLRHP
ncbi:MAG: hypothetical protein N3F09_05755 [Bacteroidia bacterium]|nr:hypothetical protein [Bacteroidia bacterium]